MALNNTQFDEIKKVFDARRAKGERELSARLGEIGKKSPAYAELDGQIAEKNFEKSKALIAGDAARAELITAQISEIIKAKEQALLDAGFPAGYDQMQYCCEACKDTGFVGGEKCSCFKRLEAETLYDASNVRGILDRENFSKYSFDYFGKMKVDPITKMTSFELAEGNYRIAREMCENFAPGRDNLLFFGPAGTGKTFLTNCITKEVLDAGHSVVYLSAISLFEQLADEMFGRSDKDVKNQLLTCELLIIDDLGTEMTNSFVVDQLFGIVNERHMRERSTIISTNLDLNQIRDTYTERVSSRLLSWYKTCRFFGDDIRLAIRKAGI